MKRDQPQSANLPLRPYLLYRHFELRLETLLGSVQARFDR